MKIVINIDMDESKAAIAKRIQQTMGIPVTADDVEARTYEGFRVTVNEWPPKLAKPIPAPPPLEPQRWNLPENIPVVEVGVKVTPDPDDQPF